MFTHVLTSLPRLVQLSNFQLLALIHSMSFPQVDYIAYSTCSVNNIENEGVVSKALSEVNEKLEGGERWKLVSPVGLKDWKRRGKAVEGLTEEQANCLCRCDPFEGDETNGFFVSYFQREKIEEGGGDGDVGGGGARVKGAVIYSEGLWKVAKKDKRIVTTEGKAVTKKVAAPAVEKKEGEAEKPKTKTQERKDKKAKRKAEGEAPREEAESGGKNRSEKKRLKKEAFKAKQKAQKQERLSKRKDKSDE